MKERVIAQRTARTVARIVQLQALKLAVENQRLLAVQKKGGIIKSNRASRSQRGDENGKQCKRNGCHECDQGEV
jgi:hypothetical protein